MESAVASGTAALLQWLAVEATTLQRPVNDTATTVYLIQLLVPVTKSHTSVTAHHRALREELTKRFGGLTAYTRAPAEGAWRADHQTTERDDIVILEVMTDTFDRGWWASLRKRLESDLGEEELVFRAIEMERV